MPMRWAYLNTPPITAATKITVAAKEQSGDNPSY